MHTPSRFILQRLSSTLLVIAFLLSSLVAALPQPTYAAPASRPAAAPSAGLSIVEVAAPDINCIFDTDCKIS